MFAVSKLIHLASAIVWIGGMAFVLWSLRPAAIALLQPPQRVPLFAAVLRRFFIAVWISIALLLATGLQMFASMGVENAPPGVHFMLAIGIVMIAIFGHVYFGPYRRLAAAAAAQDWPQGGRQLARIHPLVVANFVLGWLAIAAVLLFR